MSSEIKIYSSFTRKVEKFTPLNKGRVGIYACGVTTYDDAHLGHARQAIFFDILRNYFEYCGYNVTYVRNYTDIDDKIIDRAHKLNRDPLELSDFYVKKTAQDLLSLKVERATYEPKVTDHIKDIIIFIENLLKIGAAYVIDDEVLFDVYYFPEYGKLSRLKLDELINNDTSGYKKHPQDFSLWKAAKQGEPSWPSPWGDGRPGWHIECSVLARKYLGDSLDIHGGGIDLIFPHHENEIAQTESLTKNQFATYWIHNGLVMVDGKKMSKSLSNFMTIDQALKKYSADVIRFAILSFHYSSPIDFTEELFKITDKRVYYFYKTLYLINKLIENNKLKESGDDLLNKLSNNIVVNFESAMNDNLNIALVISQLSSTFQDINRFLKDPKINIQDKIISLNHFVDELKKITRILRIFDEIPKEYISNAKKHFLQIKNLTNELIENKILNRKKAKDEGNFNLSDSIRQELKDIGVELHDTPTGTDWDIF